jgi:putative hydrolase of the HAD superfamily
MTAAVLFDFGNTLAAYYRREEFGPILERAVARTREQLQVAGLDVVDLDVAMERAVAENREAADFRFAPMADRLARIFDLEEGARAELGESLCKCFLEPIFEVGRAYPDARSTLAHLKSQGYRTAIVSNAPWGSPPELWRRELHRLGLAQLVDLVVLCGDVGWRKPSKLIFEHARDGLGVQSDECTFVGDDLEWDIAGSAAAGMRPVLIDRDNRYPNFNGVRIRSLDDLAAALSQKPVEAESDRTDLVRRGIR